jgi:GntR family transcriptional regulator, carbon starvation induced regulator
METHSRIFDKYFRYQMIAMNYRGDVPAKQHQMLLKSALAKDFPKARTVLTEHVNSCVEDTIKTGTLG